MFRVLCQTFVVSHLSLPGIADNKRRHGGELARGVARILARGTHIVARLLAFVVDNFLALESFENPCVARWPSLQRIANEAPTRKLQPSRCLESSPPGGVHLPARLPVLSPAQHVVLRAAVPHGATAGALLELADGALHLVAGRPRALSQPDFLDVGASPGCKLVSALLGKSVSSLQSSARLEHVDDRWAPPFAKQGVPERGVYVPISGMNWVLRQSA